MIKNKSKNTKWIVVKFAAKDYWLSHFDKDPTKGVDESYSTHSSPTGKMVGILPRYQDNALALKHCAEINALNPSGGYAVCPLDYGKTSVKH